MMMGRFVECFQYLLDDKSAMLSVSIVAGRHKAMGSVRPPQLEVFKSEAIVQRARLLSAFVALDPRCIPLLPRGGLEACCDPPAGRTRLGGNEDARGVDVKSMRKTKSIGEGFSGKVKAQLFQGVLPQIVLRRMGRNPSRLVNDDEIRVHAQNALVPVDAQRLRIPRRNRVDANVIARLKREPRVQHPLRTAISGRLRPPSPRAFRRQLLQPISRVSGAELLVHRARQMVHGAHGAELRGGIRRDTDRLRHQLCQRAAAAIAEHMHGGSSIRGVSGRALGGEEPCGARAKGMADLRRHERQGHGRPEYSRRRPKANAACESSCHSPTRSSGITGPRAPRDAPVLLRAAPTRTETEVSARRFSILREADRPCPLRAKRRFTKSAGAFSPLWAPGHLAGARLCA
eukprot:scaffold7403_cov277-Pinguiococcus_pyrenoidosus.AAC.3